MNRQETLECARRIVGGDREEDYGSPEDNFAVIAKLWSIYLRAEISPTEVATMMILLKVARSMAGSGKEDNWVDIAGYAACAAELDEKVHTIHDLDEV